MFAKLACKNIKRSIKDYAIYFFTLVLGVAIFYIFNSLESQAIMLDVTERVRSMLELVDVVLGMVSFFVSCILGALIIYASRFLIKRRSQEFGVYLTLGMGKRQISFILILETLLIGLLSLVVGLALGIIASQFTSVLVANMFDADLTEFRFVFSLGALLKTLLYFSIIYLFVMIFNTINISRQKLINLLSSSRRNEKIRNKNLWLCTAVFIVASLILGVAYYLVTSGLENLVTDAEGPEILLIPIAMGIVATFLLFWSLSGILLRIFTSLKRVYYRGLNSFVLRQFSSKINTTVASISIICLMLFVTICVLGSALSINRSLHDTIKQNLPVDAKIVGHGRGPSIQDIYLREGVDLDELLSERVSYLAYRLYDFTMQDTVSNLIYATVEDGDDPEKSAAYINLEIDASLGSFYGNETLIFLNDYNQVAQLMGLPHLELADDEYAIIANYAPVMKIRNLALASGQTITINHQTLRPKYPECINGTLTLESVNMNQGVIIIPDQIKLPDGQFSTQETMLANFHNQEEAASIEQELMRIDNRFFGEDDDAADGSSERPVYYYYSVSTRQEIIDNNVGTSALVTFVGLYLGIIFLVSSAAILALKELSESSDNRHKYRILRKLGASRQMLNRALFWQIFIFFVFPLIVAVLHSVFGLMFCEFLLSTIGGISIALTIPWVVVILLAIYGGYFLITYYCSRNIIREHRA